MKQWLPGWPEGSSSSWRRTETSKETYLLSRRYSSLAWLLTSLQIQLGSQPVVKAHVGGSGGSLGPRKSPLDTEQYKELPPTPKLEVKQPKVCSAIPTRKTRVLSSEEAPKEHREAGQRTHGLEMDRTEDPGPQDTTRVGILLPRLCNIPKRRAPQPGCTKVLLRSVKEVFPPLTAGERMKSGVWLWDKVQHTSAHPERLTLPWAASAFQEAKKNPSNVDPPPPENQLPCFGEVYLFQFVSKDLDFLFIFVFLLRVLQVERKNTAHPM